MRGRAFAGLMVLLAAACAGRADSGATSGDDTTQTPTPTPVATATVPSPFVLMHGMAGWDEIGTLEYFNGIPEALTAAGYKVYVTKVDPFQTVEVRAAQAASQIDQILAESGAPKVHLIGHSQGGLDARYIVSTLGYGDRVETLTTIATPHHGTKVADLAQGLIPGDVAAAGAALASVLLGNVTGTPADLGNQIHELANSYCDGTFNPANPDDPRVRYYSVAGKTQPWLTVDPTTTDIVNPGLLASYWIVQGIEGDNDGLVSVSSGTWGTLLGEIPADHMDEIGQPPLSPHPAYDQKKFFVQLAGFLSGGAAPL